MANIFVQRWFCLKMWNAFIILVFNFFAYLFIMSFFLDVYSRTFLVILLTVHFLLHKLLQLTWKFMKENVTHKTVTINEMNQARSRNGKLYSFDFVKTKKVDKQNKRYQQFKTCAHWQKFSLNFDNLTILFYLLLSQKLFLNLF